MIIRYLAMHSKGVIAIEAPHDIEGWLWRPHGTSQQWTFRSSLGGRTFPKDAEFMPVRRAAEPSKGTKIV